MTLKAKTNIKIGSWQIEVDLTPDETFTYIHCPSERTARQLGDALAACGYHPQVYSRRRFYTPEPDIKIWEKFYCEQAGITK